MLTVEFSDFENDFISLYSFWEGKRSIITQQFENELSDLMIEVESNSLGKLKEQLNTSR